MILVKIQLIIIIANPPLGHAVWGLGFYHRPPGGGELLKLDNSIWLLRNVLPSVNEQIL